MTARRASQKAKSDNVFGQPRKPEKMFRAGLYARVSTTDQQTLPMQSRAMREYAARRGRIVASTSARLALVRRSAKRGRGCWKPPAGGRLTSCWSGDWTAGADR